MKKLDWLTLFGWPALITIILFSLLAGPLLWPDKKPPPPGPLAAAADVKYTVRNGKKPIVSEEIAEIRALYASDLFASSRGNHLPVSQSVTNRSDQSDIIPSENLLFLSFLPASNETGGHRFVMAGGKIDNYESEPAFRFHSPERSSHQAMKPAGNLAHPGEAPRRTGRHPKLSIELNGELKYFLIDPDIFKDIALPAGLKPWSIQAEVRVNSEGRVEHVFAESTDCKPAIYQEIVRRLYQYRLTNVTQACEGTIIINYPAYSTNHPGKN